MTESVTREGFVPVAGGRVWYHEARRNDATPLLLLHGRPEVPSDYLAPLEALADEWPVNRYDQLCGGRGVAPVGRHISFGQIAFIGWPAARSRKNAASRISERNSE